MRAPPHSAKHCNTLQHTATHCNTLQHTATHCNTLQHTSTHNWYIPIISSSSYLTNTPVLRIDIYIYICVYIHVYTYHIIQIIFDNQIIKYDDDDMIGTHTHRCDGWQDGRHAEIREMRQDRTPSAIVVSSLWQDGRHVCTIASVEAFKAPLGTLSILHATLNNSTQFNT